MKRSISKTRMLAVFATTTLIFIIGIWIGALLTQDKVENLVDMEQDLKLDILDLETQYLIFREDPCLIDFSPLTEQLYELGEKLDYMENKLGKDHRSILSIKDFYILLEIRHWLIIRENTERCGDQRIPILFFYSNKKDCPRCKEQGFILDYIKSNYNNTYIYSFDTNLEGSSIEAVKNVYNITSVPSVVIMDQAFDGFVSKAQIEEALSKI